MSQWVKCTSHDTGEVYYLNLIHVVAMWTTARQVTKVRLSDRVEMELKESPDDLLGAE
jgi:hypothetical protein